MSKSFWALAALSLIACSGSTSDPGSGNGNGSDGGNNVTTGSGGTSGGGPATGGLNVSETNGLSCQVAINGVVVGQTDTDINDLKPGDVQLYLGDPSESTLDGIPFHVTQDGKYMIGGLSTTVVASQVTAVDVTLADAPQYVCTATDCAWPYADGTCTGNRHPDPAQWVYVDQTGMLHGSEDPNVVSGVQMTLVNGKLSVTAVDSNLTIVDGNFDASSGAIEFTYYNNAFEVAQQVICSLQ